MSRSIEIMGYNVDNFITAIDVIPQSKPDYGQILINENVNITGDNSHGIWYYGNPKSFLYNRDIAQDIKIYDNSILEFDGTILNITNNDKIATITAKSDFYDLMGKRCLFISDQKTPAELCREILQLYGFNIDGASFQKSIDIQEYYTLIAQIYLSVNGTNNMSLLELCQHLADIGIARIYFANNKFYYESYDPDNDLDISFSIDESDIAIAPEAFNYERQAIDSYSITMVTNTITGGTDLQASLKNMDYGWDSPIRLITGGAYIGENYIKISKQTRESVTIGIYKEKGIMLNLQSAIEISYSRFNWSSKPFEIMSIDNSHPFITQIQGVSL